MGCRPNIRKQEENADEKKINELLDQLAALSVGFVVGVTIVDESGKASHLYSLGGDDVLCRGLVSKLRSKIEAWSAKDE